MSSYWMGYHATGLFMTEEDTEKTLWHTREESHV